MPTCPHCGAYVPLGESICSCGATFAHGRYDEDDDYHGGLSDILEQVKHENPYEYDFFNDLHHNLVSPYLINNMYEALTDLLDKFDAELDSVSVQNNIAYFNMIKKTEYYDATLRASFDMSNAFNDIVFYRDIITPDFTKLYESEEIKKLIEDSQRELNSQFHYFRIVELDYMLFIYAVFDEWAYIIDFEKMKLDK